MESNGSAPRVTHIGQAKGDVAAVETPRLPGLVRFINAAGRCVGSGEERGRATLAVAVNEDPWRAAAGAARKARRAAVVGHV